MGFYILLCGLALIIGTGTSFLNYYLTILSSKYIIERGSARPKLVGMLSYIGRLVIYGIIFYIFAKIYIISSFFALAGFMASKIYIIIKYAARPNFKDVRYEEIKNNKFCFERYPFKKKYVIISVKTDTASSRVRLVTHRKWKKYRQL
jgi:hypothetical protein